MAAYVLLAYSEKVNVAIYQNEWMVHAVPACHYDAQFQRTSGSVSCTSCKASVDCLDATRVWGRSWDFQDYLFERGEAFVIQLLARWASAFLSVDPDDLELELHY